MAFSSAANEQMLARNARGSVSSDILLILVLMIVFFWVVNHDWQSTMSTPYVESANQAAYSEPYKVIQQKPLSPAMYYSLFEVNGRAVNGTLLLRDDQSFIFSIELRYPFFTLMKATTAGKWQQLGSVLRFDATSGDVGLIGGHYRIIDPELDGFSMSDGNLHIPLSSKKPVLTVEPKSIAEIYASIDTSWYWIALIVFLVPLLHCITRILTRFSVH